VRTLAVAILAVLAAGRAAGGAAVGGLAAAMAVAAATADAPAKPADTNFIASPADLKARIPGQLRITKPDFVVFVPTDTSYHRRPVYLVPGRFRAGADQPVWFDEPKFFMDHDGTPLGKPGTKGRLDLALYASFTVRQGRAVLWYPDRKFFLLGRVIGDEWLQSGNPAPGGERP
jgi:hypothetical protein